MKFGDAEGVGDPLVRGVSLPVDAVRVDLQQDGAGTSGGMRRTGTVSIHPVPDLGWCC